MSLQNTNQNQAEREVKVSPVNIPPMVGGFKKKWGIIIGIVLFIVLLILFIIYFKYKARPDCLFGYNSALGECVRESPPMRNLPQQ